MKITPEIKVIQNAYMKARSENDRPEMNRLKSKAMALMNTSASEQPQVDNLKVEKYEDSKVTTNEDGDVLVISSPNVTDVTTS